MSEFEECTIEEDHEKDNFKNRVGSALRRSKRFMSGRRKNKQQEEKENISPEKDEPNESKITISSHASHDVSTDLPDGEGRKGTQTFFSSEKKVLIDGKAIKQVEVTGEKSPTEGIEMKKQRKMSRKKSIDSEELSTACRDLGKADHEGWLLKKAGGHGIVPLSWKRYWCVVKHGKIYCYKTSFDIRADYILTCTNYQVEEAQEKKKIAFRLKPAEDDIKQVVFAGETESEVKNWLEKLRLVISGVDISQPSDNAEIPDYEERKRVFSVAEKLKPEEHKSKRPTSSAFTSNTETTGMPAGFGARKTSLSQPRVRKSSTNGKPDSCLSVGSMFSPLAAPAEVTTNEEDVPINSILYEEVEVEVKEPVKTEEVKSEEPTKTEELSKTEQELVKSEDPPKTAEPEPMKTQEPEEPAKTNAVEEPAEVVAEPAKTEEVAQPAATEESTEEPVENPAEVAVESTEPVKQPEEEPQEVVLQPLKTEDVVPTVEVTIQESVEETQPSVAEAESTSEENKLDTTAENTENVNAQPVENLADTVVETPDKTKEESVPQSTELVKNDVRVVSVEVEIAEAPQEVKSEEVVVNSVETTEESVEKSEEPKDNSEEWPQKAESADKQESCVDNQELSAETIVVNGYDSHKEEIACESTVTIEDTKLEMRDEKSKSVDLGEDLEIPNPNDASLRSELSIELPQAKIADDVTPNGHVAT